MSRPQTVDVMETRMVPVEARALLQAAHWSCLTTEPLGEVLRTAEHAVLYAVGLHVSDLPLPPRLQVRVDDECRQMGH